MSSSGFSTSVTAAAAASVSAMHFRRCSTPSTRPRAASWKACRRRYSGRSSTTATCATCASCRSALTCRRIPGTSTFPHLMLRAKAKRFRDEGAALARPAAVGYGHGRILRRHPGRRRGRQRGQRHAAGRALLETTLGVARDAPIPRYESRSARAQARHDPPRAVAAPERPAAPREESCCSRPATATAIFRRCARTSSPSSSTTASRSRWPQPRNAAACRSSSWVTSSPWPGPRTSMCPSWHAGYAKAGTSWHRCPPAC